MLTMVFSLNQRIYFVVRYFSFIVIINTVDCLERRVSEMTCYVWSRTVLIRLTDVCFVNGSVKFGCSYVNTVWMTSICGVVRMFTYLHLRAARWHSTVVRDFTLRAVTSSSGITTGKFCLFCCECWTTWWSVFFYCDCNNVMLKMFDVHLIWSWVQICGSIVLLFAVVQINYIFYVQYYTYCKRCRLMSWHVR